MGDGDLGHGRGNTLTLTHELRFPHSLGLLYSAFTYYCGFRVNSGEYKLMGLAPYGEPRYVDRIAGTMVDVKDDGSVWMDMSYFNYCQGLTMTSAKFDELFGGPPRQPEVADHRSARWTSPRRSRRSPKTRCSRPRGTCTRRPGRAICAWPAASRSTASATAHPARRAVREHLDSAGRRRRGRRARRRAVRLASAAGPAAARRRPAAMRCTARCSGRRSPIRKSAPRSTRPARATRMLPDDDALCERGRRADGARRWSSAGSRTAWSSARARSAPAASSATRAARRCSRR